MEDNGESKSQRQADAASGDSRGDPQIKAEASPTVAITIGESLSSSSSSWSAFKRAQVRYRRQAHAPDRLDDLNDMIDFSRPISSPDTRVQKVNTSTLPSSAAAAAETTLSAEKVPAGTDDCYRGPIYTLQDFPGFFYAPQALSASIQMALAHRAVTVYCERPHATNMDALVNNNLSVANDVHQNHHSPNSTMWEQWKQQHDLRNEPRSIDAPPQRKKQSKCERCFENLTWATMGYHYDWSARSYRKEVKSYMPPEMQQLGQLFARTWQQMWQNSWSASLLEPTGRLEAPLMRPYTASASIVNYYHSKSLMGGHRDDLELALEQPIVSLSLGRPAVFLLGGPTKDDAHIVPLIIRPGDVLVLGGASRLNYHAMVRLLPAAGLPPVDESLLQQVQSHQITEPTCSSLASYTVPPEDLAALHAFLSQQRINLNLRQVYPEDEPKDLAG